MNRFLLFVFAALIISSCKKDIELAKQVPATSNRGEASNTSKQICFGNSWDNDQIFYPDWFYENAGVPTDLQPLVYNNKVYVPDYGGQQVHIFDGTSWQHILSHVPIETRYHNISFVIGNKGYIGRMLDDEKEFYQYNFANNTWLRKADCPFEGKYAPAVFSIGTKGYVAGGAYNSNDVASQELWEYNSTNNTWARKTNIPVGVYEMSFFTVNNKAYLVNGKKNFNEYNTTLYQYDPAINLWTTKAAFPGEKRNSAIAFVIEDKAYCGGGKGFSSDNLKDYYKYDVATNSWTRVADMSVDFMRWAVYGFSINSRGYAVYHHRLLDDLYMVKYTPLMCADF